MPKRKRRMRSFKMEEISAVDRPAQEPATVTIMKRDDGAVIGGMLEALHDAVPNGEKAAVAAIIAKLDSGETPEAMAREMLDRASSQQERLVSAFMDASGTDRESALEAVNGSRIGRRIAALIGAAERMIADGDDAEDVEARRRATMANMAARVGTTRLTAKSVTATAIGARDATDDELDRLAKARAERTGEGFYTAYERVCETDEGLNLIVKRDGFHAMAIGSPEHGRSQSIFKADFEEDTAMRGTSLYKNAQAGVDARAADDALLKRAKQIQVERCNPRLTLFDALNMAKAELPTLAKAARI